MKKDFDAQEIEQIKFWDGKSATETFETLDWVGIKEQNDFFEFAGLSGKLKVLEIGAGTGRWTIPLLRRGFVVTATDISQKSLDVLLEKAQKLGLEKKLTVVLSNFVNPRLKRKFDAIFCFCVMHHFDPQKRQVIFSNIVKSLKKGGKIYILEPNPLNSLYYLIYLKRWILDEKGVNRWSTENGFLRSSIWKLKWDLRHLGLEKIENRWYSYLPSRFANYCPFVLKFNEVMNKIPFLGLFSAFIWMKGGRNDEDKK